MGSRNTTCASVTLWVLTVYGMPHLQPNKIIRGAPPPLEHGLEGICRVPQVVTDFRQHGTKVWDEHRCPGGLPGGNPLAELCHALLALALHGQRPSTQARFHR